MFETYIQPLIIHHGYWVVFLVVMLESTGVPLPGESALLLAAAYAGATNHLNIAYVIVAAVAGAVIGDNFGYWVGRSIGARLLASYGRFVGLTPNRLRLGEYLFERHGGKIIFVGRFIDLLNVSQPSDFSRDASRICFTAWASRIASSLLDHYRLEREGSSG